MPGLASSLQMNNSNKSQSIDWTPIMQTVLAICDDIHMKTVVI